MRFPDLLYVGWVGEPDYPKASLFHNIQVIVVESEKETGGFLAPSITIVEKEGWKGNATVEKCQKGSQN